jgi:hypothetical protein
MTAVVEAQAELVEISWTASEAIASWRRILAQTVGDVRPNLERACVELLRLAEIEPSSKKTIVDELAALALTAGIDDDEAQAIFARAAKAPPDTINGCATTQSAGGKNALVAFPLRAFENVRIQTEDRNYLVKGLLANTGLAVILGAAEVRQILLVRRSRYAHCPWLELPGPQGAAGAGGLHCTRGVTVRRWIGPSTGSTTGDVIGSPSASAPRSTRSSRDTISVPSAKSLATSTVTITSPILPRSTLSWLSPRRSSSCDRAGGWHQFRR